MGMETHLEDHVFTVNTNQSYNITCFQSTDNIFILFRISFIDLFSFRFTCTCIVQNIAKLNDNVLNFVIMIFETKLDKTRYMYTKLLNNGNNGFSKFIKKKKMTKT